jgi:hypothetical protein
MTVNELKVVLKYDPRTGHLTWLRKSARGAIGARAGYVGSRGYRYIRVNGRSYLEHRIAWALHYGEWPTIDVDHINRDKTDNRLSNLRQASPSENAHNVPARAGAVSQFKGVFLERKHNRLKWRARIKANGVRRHIGWFDDEVEAAHAYDAAALDMMGEFAVLNFAASRESFGTERAGGNPSGKSQPSLTAGASAPALSGE